MGSPTSPADFTQTGDMGLQLKWRMHWREQQVGHPTRGSGELIAIGQQEWELINWEGVDALIDVGKRKDDPRHQHLLSIYVIFLTLVG